MTDVSHIYEARDRRDAEKWRELQANFLLAQFKQMKGRSAHTIEELEAWCAQNPSRILPATPKNIRKYRSQGLIDGID